MEHFTIPFSAEPPTHDHFDSLLHGKREGQAGNVALHIFHGREFNKPAKSNGDQLYHKESPQGITKRVLYIQ